jgi:hypothetical protein
MRNFNQLGAMKSLKEELNKEDKKLLFLCLFQNLNYQLIVIYFPTPFSKNLFALFKLVTLWLCLEVCKNIFMEPKKLWNDTNTSADIRFQRLPKSWSLPPLAQLE